MGDRSWKMYPLGVLFGAGFDTSSGMLIPICCLDSNHYVTNLLSWFIVSPVCLESKCSNDADEE